MTLEVRSMLPLHHLLGCCCCCDINKATQNSGQPPTSSRCPQKGTERVRHRTGGGEEEEEEKKKKKGWRFPIGPRLSGRRRYLYPGLTFPFLRAAGIPSLGKPVVNLVFSFCFHWLDVKKEIRSHGWQHNNNSQHIIITLTTTLAGDVHS
ncbi:hypothetical protein TEQG_03564 [Trichophyton equinum CBS 127.97]|uniref:Uncharacterized protein n=1 Tax=Trichophyton equinum (strain ATCC MYA-4606 / CBS 127.97) TaxID=559882 RepID=F2PR43_TRIEC|nr:hypothetical protein TEQG_03564 [Trichophyton equinum CBS 127.97]